jgi:hypothetical protein
MFGLAKILASSIKSNLQFFKVYIKLRLRENKS